MFYINNIVVTAAVGVVTTIWFAIGGIWDLRRLFKRLAAKEANVLDDGRVVGHVSAADVALVENVEHIVIKEAHETDPPDELKDPREEDSDEQRHEDEDEEDGKS